MTDTTIGHCKLCEPTDFRNPELRKLIGTISRSERGAGRPPRRVGLPGRNGDRRQWEAAMSLRAFDSLGVLGEDAELLGIGSGIEPLAYCLTQRARRVFVTDLDRAKEAWNPRRLVVQPMDPLELRYEDGCFDGVFCSSWIEHLGDVAAVRRGIEEIFRVLRPGGVAALATEFRLEGTAPGVAGTLLFDESELRELVLDGLLWTLATPLDTRRTDQTISARRGEHLWTSVHLALVKLSR